MSNVKSDTVARTIILALCLTNQMLAVFGKEKITFVENDIYQVCSLIATLASSLISWWKNNSFTKEAIEADNTLAKLKANK